MGAMSAYRSPTGALIALSRLSCSLVNLIESAAAFSSRRETRLVPGIGTPRARAERDFELVAQDQVLQHEVVALMEKGRQRGEEDAE
jgi:hypothetical protein